MSLSLCRRRLHRSLAGPHRAIGLHSLARPSSSHFCLPGNDRLHLRRRPAVCPVSLASAICLFFFMCSWGGWEPPLDC